MNNKALLVGLMSIFIFSIISNGVMAFEPTYSCANDTHLTTRIDLDVGSRVITIEENRPCEFGCDNSTWLSLGYPNCIESPVQTVIIGITIIALFIILMRFLL